MRVCGVIAQLLNDNLSGYGEHPTNYATIHFGEEARCTSAVINAAGWSSPVARWAHNPKVDSSNLSPATN